MLALLFLCLPPIAVFQERAAELEASIIELRSDESGTTHRLLDGTPVPSLEALADAVRERIAARSAKAAFTIDADSLVTCGEVMALVARLRKPDVGAAFDGCASAATELPAGGVDVDRNVRVAPPAAGGSTARSFEIVVSHPLQNVAPCPGMISSGPKTCGQWKHWEVIAPSRRVFLPNEWNRLLTILRDEADTERDQAEPIFSKRAVTIHADALAPWGFVEAVIDACEKTGIYKIDVGLSRPEEGAPRERRSPSAGRRPLTTAYASGSTLRVASRTDIALSSSCSSLTWAGRPVPVPRGFVETNEAWLRVVKTDRVLATAEGYPTFVRRTLDEASGRWKRLREEERTGDAIASPWNAITVTIDASATEPLRIRTPDGDQSAALSAQLPGLGLDALLPPYDVSVGENWPLHAEQVLRGLGWDEWVEIFPQLAELGWRRHTGVGALRILAISPWRGRATLVDLEREVDGLKCAAIEFTIDFDDQFPEAGDDSGATIRDAQFRSRLDGQLLFARELQRPLRVEAKGTWHAELDREEQGLFGHCIAEGTITCDIRVSEPR